MSSHGKVKLRKEAWSGGDTLLAKAVARPMLKFMAQEAASGIVMLAATAIALIWVNVNAEGYDHFWHVKVDLHVGDTEILHESLAHLVNDALMAIFFFVVGMEIKSELVVGDLRNPKVAALPVMGAIGGMLFPAGIYFALNAGTEVSGAWGIPMATDIAFALGVLALMGSKVPAKLKLFLLTLAIVDDIGGILVIAIFYSAGLNYQWLSLALVVFLVIVGLKSLKVWSVPVYLVLGIVVWYATLRSGVHATIAGVVLGLATPAKPLVGRSPVELLSSIMTGDSLDDGEITEANWKVRESVAVTTRLARLLSPWTSFVIVPIFALANAGVVLSMQSLEVASQSRLAWGVALGLVLGKPIGITLFSYLGVKTNIATMPPGVNFSHILGGGAVAGIGFTLSLFIAKLALGDDLMSRQGEAIISVLVASIVASILGWVLLTRAKPVPIAAPAEPSPTL